MCERDEILRETINKLVAHLENLKVKGQELQKTICDYSSTSRTDMHDLLGEVLRVDDAIKAIGMLRSD